MNVDEAMAYWKQERTKDDMYYGMPETICDILSAEVERLRSEVQRLDIAGTHSCHADCPKLPCVQRREIERLKDENEWMGIAGQQMARHLAEAKAELAAAKAASAVPVGITDLELCNSGQKIEFYIEGDKADGAKMLAWLRDRMKGGEG